MLNTTPDLKKMKLRTGASELSDAAPESAPETPAPTPETPAPVPETPAPTPEGPAESTTETAEAASLPEVPEHVPYLLVGGGTASFAAFRAIKARDATAKVRSFGRLSLPAGRGSDRQIAVGRWTGRRFFTQLRLAASLG